MGRAYNLIGERSGRLLVVKFCGSDGKQNTWECKCDCGGKKIVTTVQITSGRSKSCGCLHKEIVSYEDKEEAPFNKILYEYIRGSKDRGLEFSLNRSDFWEIIKSDCHYCGSPPNRIIKPQRGEGYLVCNGVDRKDSSKGYDIENSVSCCKICNRSKSNMEYKEFLDWLDQIKRFREGKNENNE